MEIAYSESILASYVTYKELYSNENYKSAYQILAEFIKYIISTENIYNFSIPELNKKMRENFGFVLPNAVIKSAVKKLDFIEKIEHSEQYGVNGKSVYIDKNFFQYKEKAEKINSDLMEKLYSYAIGIQGFSGSKEELTQELIRYLLDESYSNKSQEIISAFIVNNSENDIIVNQLNAIREGAVLYLGLNCNIVETGSFKSNLTLFLDTEILFDLYGYNGLVYQNLALDLISLIKEANTPKKRIKIRYFEETKNEISMFFSAASDIVRNKTYFKENVAMKAIVNGCENTTDVSDKEADFYHVLQYKYGIILDDKENYYHKSDYEANLEIYHTGTVDTEIEESLRQLSHINKLRKNQKYYDYTKCGYLFVTETRKTLELSKKIAEDQTKDDCTEDGTRVCGLAINMSLLTNILWYKLNKGFGACKFPQNIDSVIKAKIVLANFISQNVFLTYDKYKKQYEDGDISEEQLAGRLLCLREKNLKPEDITINNLGDNLNFDSDYLCKYEEEREMQRVQLKEKDDIIKQIKMDNDNSLKKVHIKLSETNEKLKKTQSVAEQQKAEIENQNAIIKGQQVELDMTKRSLEKYESKEKRKKERLEKLKKVIKFFLAILFRVGIVIIIIFLSYIFARFVKADAANTAGIIVGLLGTVISAVDIVKNVYNKIFKSPKN